MLGDEPSAFKLFSACYVARQTVLHHRNCRKNNVASIRVGDQEVVLSIIVYLGVVLKDT